MDSTKSSNRGGRSLNRFLPVDDCLLCGRLGWDSHYGERRVYMDLVRRILDDLDLLSSYTALHSGERARHCEYY